MIPSHRDTARAVLSLGLALGLVALPLTAPFPAAQAQTAPGSGWFVPEQQIGRAHV